MYTYVLLAIAGAVILYVITRLKEPALGGHVERALKEKQTVELVEYLAARPATSRPAAFNQAIRRLWDAYERDLAAELIRELGRLHEDVHIAQYWMRELMTVEPALARRVMDRAFLDAHYKPAVAKQCGSFG